MTTQADETIGPFAHRAQLAEKMRLARFEPLLLLIGLIVFFLINLTTADKTPTVWIDEVMYQDPAVNLYQGHGFHSAAWFLQTRDKFWAGNVPLYQFVLFCWLKIFGFSIFTVRAFHHFAVTVAVLMTWLAIRRLNLISMPANRLAFCAILALSSASTFAYRFARPESLAMLLLAFTLFAFSLRPRWFSWLVLCLCAVLLVWNGLQFAVYLGLICLLAWFFVPRPFRAGLLALCGGCVLGGTLLYFFYQYHGVWKDFEECIRHHTIANRGTHYPGTHPYGAGLREKLRQIPGLYVDYSLIPLLVLWLWEAGRLFRSKNFRWRSPFVFGFVSLIAIPLGLHAVGIFPIYYFWMAFFPFALGICAQLDSWRRTERGHFTNFAFSILLVMSCLVGLPRRLAVASFEWQARSYAPIMKIVSPYVPGNKLVFSDFAAYYAAKQHGAEVILPNHIHLLTDSDKARVSVAIVRQDDASFLNNHFGGEWRDTGAALKPASTSFRHLRENLDSRQYDLRVFVRLSD
ncbi:MAG TPA: hypothetical protein VFB72_19010 [Verrucomicrobiae bacterium]|nr:hypothetical protein [Verrucomicrobiae bacterium]